MENETYHIQNSLLGGPGTGRLLHNTITSHAGEGPSGAAKHEYEIYNRWNEWVDLHEEMSGDISVGCVAEFVSKTFGQGLDSCLGRVIGCITTMLDVR